MSEKMKRFYGEYAVGIFLVILFLACILFIPKFGSITNLMNISTQIAINGLMGHRHDFCHSDRRNRPVGGRGGGSGLCTGVGALSEAGRCECAGMSGNFPGNLSGAWLGRGLFTGFFVNKLKVLPFIASLATCNICRGAAYLYTNASADSRHD